MGWQEAEQVGGSLWLRGMNKKWHRLPHTAEVSITNQSDFATEQVAMRDPSAVPTLAPALNTSTCELLLILQDYTPGCLLREPSLTDCPWSCSGPPLCLLPTLIPAGSPALGSSPHDSLLHCPLLGWAFILCVPGSPWWPGMNQAGISVTEQVKKACQVPLSCLQAMGQIPGICGDTVHPRRGHSWGYFPLGSSAAQGRRGTGKAGSGLHRSQGGPGAQGPT